MRAQHITFNRNQQFNCDKVIIQWNPGNTTTIGPKYFGRNNGVVVLTGLGIKLQLYVFNDVIRN